ncbi:MAG TPA: MerR family transcriptional regulator [Acidimicrobiia bacterium]
MGGVKICRGNPGGNRMADDGWRIDDLAREAGITVDTIRYYAREGLMPAPTPAGRHRLYGSRHLDRLRRIRELQERRFSLAAIRAIVETNRPGIDDLFSGSGRTYTLDELIERSGVAPELVERIRAVDLLPDPVEFGRDAYDETDLVLLDALVELQRIGMPAEVLVELGTIYVRNFQVLQREVIDMLAGRTRPDWQPELLDAVQIKLSASAGKLIPAIDRVLNYVHQRTLQRFTLDAIRRAQDHGVEVDLDPS